jgi:hypothetical protein
MPILGNHVGKIGGIGTSIVTRYVSASGSDSADGSFATPYATIGKALTAAPNNATVVIRQGTYIEPLTITKPVKVKSYNDETVTVKPNAGQPAAAITIQANNVLLHGLTVDATNRRRGIDIIGAHITIRKCTVKNCVGTVTEQYGQGIDVTDSLACEDITIEDCTIFNVTTTVSGEETFCHAIYSACAKTRVIGGEYYNIGGYAVHCYSSSGFQGGDLIASGLYVHNAYGGVGAFAGNALTYNSVFRSLVLAMVSGYGTVTTGFYHNTVADCSNAIETKSLGDLARVEYANNVLLRSTFAVHMDQPSASLAQATVHHNLRDTTTQPDYRSTNASGFTVSHINATFSPITDDGGVNIKPTAGNPAIAAGVTIASVTTDRGGNARSATPTLGAWEAA